MIHFDMSLVYTVINLIVLYLLMKKFLFGPVTQIMEKRRALIEGQMSEAQKSRQEALALKEEYDAALNSAKEESRRILQQAKGEAVLQAEHIVQDAQQEAGQILQKAQVTVEADREAAMDKIQGQVAELAMAAACKIMARQGAQEDRALYEEFMREAGEVHDTDSH